MTDVLIVAAEASSGLFAQRLLEHWKKNNKKIRSFGVGTQQMEDLGFERLGKAEEMAVVGVSEVLEHYSALKKVFNTVIAEANRRKPRLVILMDYPGFNLKLAKELSPLGLNVVYYISPQVWAWKKNRVKIIKRYCKKVYVIFPFELSFYKSLQIPVEFVGHPALDELDSHYLDAKRTKIERNRRGIADDEILIGLMPGSRKSELKHHMQTQLEVAKKLCQAYEKVKIAILVAPTFSKSEVQDYLQDVRFPYMLIKDEPLAMIRLTDFILAASGTATLMVGLCQKPMVVMYKLNWLTGVFANLFVKGVRYFCIVNLIFEKEVVPERFQSKANPEELFQLMKKYIEVPDYAASVKSDLAQLHQRLGQSGATQRLAQSLEEYLQHD